MPKLLSSDEIYPEFAIQPPFDLVKLIKTRVKDINDCPTIGCSETGQEVSRYALKLAGLYRQMVRSYCPICKSFYAWPASVLSKKEYKKLHHET